MKPNRMIPIAAAGFSLALGAAAVTAHAGPKPDGPKPDKHAARETDQSLARAALQRGEILPLAKILGFAAKHAPGDVIEVELERKRQGGFIYEVKVLSPNGRLREVELDARTGALVKVEEE